MNGFLGRLDIETGSCVFDYQDQPTWRQVNGDPDQGSPAVLNSIGDSFLRDPKDCDPLSIGKNGST